MEYFPTTREAKQFLIDTIVEQAQRDSILLSELERKMLYFSEVDEAPADIYEVNEAFEQQYDTDEYEQKIASIVRSFRAWAKKHDTSALARWTDAKKKLSSEDHYLLVLIALAGGTFSTNDDPINNPSRLMQILFVIALIAFIVLYIWLQNR